MPSLRHITLAIFLLLFSFTSYAQQSRTWTNEEGKSFRGRVVDCDGLVAKFKVDGLCVRNTLKFLTKPKIGNIFTAD